MSKNKSRYGEGKWFLKMKPKEHLVALVVGFFYFIIFNLDNILNNDYNPGYIIFSIGGIYISYKIIESLFYKKLAVGSHTYKDKFTLITTIVFLVFILLFALYVKYSWWFK